MYKNFFLTIVAVAMSLTAKAQTSMFFKSTTNSNPLSASVYCADPTALEYNGRLYVYGSNDHQQFIKNGKKGENKYGDIKSLVVFSTDDMVNWTFHGTIDVGKVCSGWGRSFAASWAPSVTWRTNIIGKPEFFLYFANSGGSVGVLKASSPVGPWTSPLNGPMITGSTPGVSPCNWVFDPGVMIDEDGTGWIAFGGGDPNNQGSDLQPNNARIAKLKSNMTAIDGRAVKLPAPYHFEASELNIIGGKFVYTYCSSWRGRNDWNKYQNDKGISVSAPGSCTMCYMVSDDPMDPDSWKYKGVYGPHPGTSPNNHSHLHKFQGTYYHIYHSGALLENMKKKNAVPSDASTYRSICVNKATVVESAQKISTVTLDSKGVEPIKKLNPYELQEAETMATCGGVDYEHFSNLIKNTEISNLGNDASSKLLVKMVKDAWTLVRNVDFGTSGATSLTVSVKGKGVIEVRLGTRTSTPVATIETTSAYLSDYKVDVDPALCKGTKDVYFVCTESSTFQFDSWQFSNEVPDGISAPFVFEPSPSIPRYYDFGGRLLKGKPAKGFYLDEKGKKYWAN